MNIIQRFIPASNKETRPGIKMDPKYITIHETDNTKPGADAEAHAKLQERGNSRIASWHIQVDEVEAIQSIPFDEVAYHAGTSVGNSESIGIEICVNSDGNYEKAVQNAAQVTAQIMKQFNLSANNIVPHKLWSGKNCPRNLLPRWQEFINLCTRERQKLDKTDYQVVTGGLNLQMLFELSEFLVSRNWGGYTSSITIGNFVEGSEMLTEMENWLKTKGWYYTKSSINLTEVQVSTGGLDQNMMKDLSEFLVRKNWGAFSTNVTIGDFKIGSEIFSQMEAWLNTKGWYFTIQ